MTPAMQNLKLGMIAQLRTREEIEGWRDGIRISGREYFPGEASALATREKQIMEGR